jgi:hypothetical protein
MAKALGEHTRKEGWKAGITSSQSSAMESGRFGRTGHGCWFEDASRGPLAGIWLAEWRELRLSGGGLNRQSGWNTPAWPGSFSCRVEDTPARPTTG